MIAIQEETKGASRNLSAAVVVDCDNGSVHPIEQSIADTAQHLDKPLQVATLSALKDFVNKTMEARTIAYFPREPKPTTVSGRIQFA